MKLTTGGVCKSGGSWKNHTGTWRVFRPVLDEEKCIGCGYCETFCPEATVEVQGNIAVFDYTYCKGCGICQQECPVEAIEMKEEDELEKEGEK